MTGRSKHVTACLLLLSAVGALGFECFHDELPLDPVRTGLDGTRGITNEPIRIRPVFVEDQIARTNLPSYVLADNGPLYDALDVLSRALSVKRVQNNFTIQPSVSCAGIGSCSGCSCQAPALQPIECGTYYTITEEDAILGTTGECTPQGACEPFGPDNGGMADTDFVLYITANGTEGTGECHRNDAAFAYASACVIDENGQPLVGYLNLCPNNINTNVELKGDAVYDAPLFTSIFVHQILHTLGFSEKLFTDFERQPVTSLQGETYKNTPLKAIVTPTVVEMAREYYNCSDLAGVFVEEASSSHWEARILLPDVMANRIYPVYTVLSELTLALLSDSGWYEVNYTVAESSVQGYNIPLLYGKGLSCSFLRDDCRSTSSYPYYCGLEINTCSFEGIWKATCRANEYLSNDCRVPDPDPVLDCREDSAIPNELRLETSRPNSRCFRSSITLISNPFPPGLGAGCYNIHPLFDGSTYYYGIETTADDVSQPSTSLFHFCTPTTERVDAAEELNLTGYIECADIELTEFFLAPENVTSEDQPEELCDSSCLTCVRIEDPTSCLTCSGTGVTISGDPPGECITPEYSVRLRDGSSDERGRVEIFLSDEWRTICSDTWDINIAHVVCQQLGYLRAEEAYIGSTGGQFGSGSDSIIESIQCNGNEALIRDCSIDITSSGTCSHSQDAAVICTDSCRGDRVTSNGLYEMTYFVEGDAVDFTITVETTGWVGLGFSTDQLMPNSDIIIGGIDPNGTFISDRYATARAVPPVDEQQDIEMTAITTENGITTVQFRRQRDTGDSMDDITLDVCRYFLYAWGGTFDTNNPSSLGIHSHREAGPYQVCIPPDTICRECGFGTYRSGTECTSECPLGEVADYNPRRCRMSEDSDINSAGYILNATRYEAAAFVDEVNDMLGAGSYLFTINIMSGDGSPVDNNVIFVLSPSDSNFNDVEGSSSNIRVIVTADPITAGTYMFIIRIQPVTFPIPPVSEVEAEVRVLPRPRPCSEVTCENGGRCEEIVINARNTFNCICVTGFNGFFCENNINDCYPDPCVNNGTCMDMVNDYACICSGYSGKNCDEDINECEVYQPCQNNATCINSEGDYSCQCANYFEDKNCSTLIPDPCDDQPCDNGVCERMTARSYMCMCDPDFTGSQSCTQIDDCEGINCNDGVCEDGINNFTCNCTFGYTGFFCESNINDCMDIVCQNGADCLDLVGNFTCECLEGYQGRFCENDIDPCDPDPCRNEGTCLATSESTYECDCIFPYTGQNCTEEVDPCDQLPCMNDGNCTRVNASIYTCACPDTHYGDDCEFFNFCFDSPCRNNGSCVNQLNNFTCECETGYTGVTCEDEINFCDTEPCASGMCMPLFNNFSCICYPGWTGRLCDEDIDYCMPISPCSNGGVCMEGNSTFNCDCSPVDFEGLTCDMRIDNCDPDPCENGTCTDLTRNYMCNCFDGFMGRNCSVDINECDTLAPCQNGGTCNNFDGGYSCKCPSGYTGQNCSEDVNECEVLQPCQNNATCINSEGDYSCQCANYFEDKNCSTLIPDPCDDQPCDNGVCERMTARSYMCICDPDFTGTLNCTQIDDCEVNNCTNGFCVDGIGMYECSCFAGYTGLYCEEDIDDCNPNLCLNDGQCIDLVANFTCNCTEGFDGALCEIDIDPCDTLPCINGGTCIYIDFETFSCNCSFPYTGNTCSEEIDPCDDLPCLNDGNCTKLDPINFECSCPETHYGDNCESFNFCISSPCENNGTCSNLEDNFMCDCVVGYTSPTCNETINRCENITCINGQCVPLFNDYRCDCYLGWSGDLCDMDINDCFSNDTCQNDGICMDGNSTFSCDCSAVDFEGSLCNELIDNCSPDPCVNGTCTDGVRDYFCNCISGVTGKNCDMDIMECNQTMLPCNESNTEMCAEQFGSFICLCKDGFTGPLCNVNIDDCASLPCLNNGTCLDGIADYTCDCPDDYEGETCQFRNCFDDLCINGNCMFNGTSDFFCSCQDGYTGSLCDEDINECQTIPDLCTEGTCNNTQGSYMCNCPYYRSGDNCENRLNICIFIDCLNQGDCIDLGISDQFFCNCTDGYRGTFCEENIDECIELEEPCNSGNCSDTDGSYSCSCPWYLTGDRCEERLDICLLVDCNNGTCVDLLVDGNYLCECNDGFTGGDCDMDINECLNQNCSGHGTCQNLLNRYSCSCDLGYTGMDCSNRYTICEDGPCVEGQYISCVNDQANEDYICMCEDGYRGKMCEEDIDFCLEGPAPCNNNGICFDGLTNYTCLCYEGLTGPTCRMSINDCIGSPCQNGGTCMDGNNTFTCRCTLEWDGPLCEDQVSSGYCDLFKPCHYLSTCVDTVDAYECICAPDFTGQNCTEQIDHCATRPCQNAARCIDEIDDYSCICPRGFTGKDCETYAGPPTNCTLNEQCGYYHYCMIRCSADDLPDHVTLLNYDVILGGESVIYVPEERYPDLSGNFTIMSYFRQEPNDTGYIFFWSADSVNRTFGVLVDAAKSEIRVLWLPPGETTVVVKIFSIAGDTLNMNRYHTLAVIVSRRQSDLTDYDIVVSLDGFYRGHTDAKIDFSSPPDPFVMVGGRLPVPGHFRFEGKISQVVVFNRPFTLDQIKFMQNFFANEQIGECLPALQEEEACRAPTVATSSLCTASVERCNPATRCLPDVLGNFACRNAPVECQKDEDCTLLENSICGQMEFPKYGNNFFDTEDNMLPKTIQYLQREPMVFDYGTRPRPIMTDFPDVTKDLTIFALVDQNINNDGYVVAKGISADNRDYGLYLKSSSKEIQVVYRTISGGMKVLVYRNIRIAGEGPTVVAAIIDSENNRGELFVNCVSHGRRSLQEQPMFMPDSDKHMLWVGGRPESRGFDFRGTIRDLFVSNEVMSYDVIKLLCAESLSGTYSESKVSRYCFQLSESGKYCHANNREDNVFRCTSGDICNSNFTVEDQSMIQEHDAPFDTLGPLGICEPVDNE